MGVAHNGLERLEVRGQDVLIVGAGAIGLLGVSIAKALGATRSVPSHPNEGEFGLVIFRDSVIQGTRVSLGWTLTFFSLL